MKEESEKLENSDSSFLIAEKIKERGNQEFDKGKYLGNFRFSSYLSSKKSA